MSYPQKPRVVSLPQTPSFNIINNLTLKETCPKQVDHYLGQKRDVPLAYLRRRSRPYFRH
jgi:hypothetical protein